MEIISASAFLKGISKLQVTAEDLRALEAEIVANPQAGDASNLCSQSQIKFICCLLTENRNKITCRQDNERLIGIFQGTAMRTKRDTKFGSDLMEALPEVRAHQRGKVALPTRLVDAISAKQVKAIRTAHAKSPKEFEARFGIPARTIEGWEQGRKLDVSARILMAMIDREPQVVEATVGRLKLV